MAEENFWAWDFPSCKTVSGIRVMIVGLISRTGEPDKGASSTGTWTKS
jgi:hypothetical protein